MEMNVHSMSLIREMPVRESGEGPVGGREPVRLGGGYSRPDLGGRSEGRKETLGESVLDCSEP